MPFLMVPETHKIIQEQVNESLTYIGPSDVTVPLTPAIVLDWAHALIWAPYCGTKKNLISP